MRRTLAVRAVSIAVVLAIPQATGRAQSAGTPSTGALAQRIQQITERPEFRHSLFGIELLDLTTGQVVYALNGDKLFVPGSTTKLLTEGAALQLLGPDFRFHTRVYRTGPVSRGTLQGDLVLVASGDPNLSGRIRPDSTLAFENEDHAYGGSPDTKAVPGDPLMVIRALARQVRARGITAVRGHVIVDASLFPEGERELGTGVVISPIIVNDNLVDVTITPGRAEGEHVSMAVSPATGYVRFVDRVTTAAPGSRPFIRWSNDSAGPAGSHVVTVTGSMPAGGPSILYSYAVPVPSRFAEVVLVEALREAGVSVALSRFGERRDLRALAASYTDANLVAEHVSLPLSEEVKVTLKVSQNLHASAMPYTLGALRAHIGTAQGGLTEERKFLEQAGLDLSGASQGDGAGGSAHFTPDFMVHYLAYMAKQKSFPSFFAALPVLGRDGTLWNVQRDSPAAGQVHAKTGTYGREDLLNGKMMVDGKGLAGYIDTADGRRLAFAIYANNVLVSTDPDAITTVVGEALGEIAAAAYEVQP